MSALAVLAPAAGAVDTKIDLHNNTAQVGTDCPDTINDYWHFVLTPNNAQFVFQSITLNLDGTPTLFAGPPDADGPIIQNNGQNDNVFVKVPGGFALDEIVLEGSFAMVSGGTPGNFNLSHLCVGTGDEFGELSVNKVVTGDTAGAAAATYHVTVACTLEGSPSKSGAFDLVPGGPAQTLTQIPEGSTCTVTEDPQVLDPTKFLGSVTVTYSSNNVLIEVGDRDTVTVTNSYVGVTVLQSQATQAPVAQAVVATAPFTG